MVIWRGVEVSRGGGVARVDRDAEETRLAALGGVAM